MLENWVNLQMKLRKYIYLSYQFTYKILDITIFNESEVIDQELKLAQASVPNKEKLCAACGISSPAVIGNILHEGKMFKDIFDLLTPLQSSYTTSGNQSSDGGRPTKDDDDLSASGETTRENDTNNPDNRT